MKKTADKKQGKKLDQALEKSELMTAILKLMINQKARDLFCSMMLFAEEGNAIGASHTNVFQHKKTGRVYEMNVVVRAMTP